MPAETIPTPPIPGKRGEASGAGTDNKVAATAKPVAANGLRAFMALPWDDENDGADASRVRRHGDRGHDPSLFQGRPEFLEALGALGRGRF
jgi:hypothetical protein